MFQIKAITVVSIINHNVIIGLHLFWETIHIYIYIYIYICVCVCVCVCVGWGDRICWLICRRSSSSPNECLGMTLNHLILRLLSRRFRGMWSIYSLWILSGLLKPGEIVPVSVPFLSQIEALKDYCYWWFKTIKRRASCLY